MVASFAGKIMTTVMMPGSSRVRMRNERVRTRSRYSRLMISQRLRIGLTRLRFTRGWFTHSVNEDFFQRRFHQLELAEPCARGRQLQQFLCIGAGREPRFHIVAVVIERLHQPGFLEEAGVTVVLDLDR